MASSPALLAIITIIFAPVALLGLLGGIAAGGGAGLGIDIVINLASNVLQTLILGLTKLATGTIQALSILFYEIVYAITAILDNLLFLIGILIEAVLATWFAGLWGWLIQILLTIAIFALATFLNFGITGLALFILALIALAIIAMFLLYNIINFIVQVIIGILMTIAVLIVQVLFWIATFILAMATSLVTSLLSFAGPILIGPLVLVIGSALFFTARTIFQVQMGAQVQGKAMFRNFMGWAGIVLAVLVFVASYTLFTIVGGIASLLTGILPFAWLLVPTILGLAFFALPWLGTVLTSFGAIAMSAIRKFRSGIMLPRNIVLSSMAIAAIAFVVITAGYLMAWLTSAFTMMVPSLMIHVATIEVAVAMLVTIALAIALIAIFTILGFVISAIVTGIGLGAVVSFMAIAVLVFLLATIGLLLAGIIAIVLGFLATLLPPLIPLALGILPLIIAIVIWALVMLLQTLIDVASTFVTG